MSYLNCLAFSVAEYIIESIIRAATTISKDGRTISWANISALLGLPSSTIRDSAGRAGVGTIKEIQEFILDGSQQVLQDVIVTGKVRDKIDIAESDDGNTVSVTSVSSKNKTIASVVKQCQVDLDLYEIVSPIVAHIKFAPVTTQSTVPDRNPTKKGMTAEISNSLNGMSMTYKFSDDHPTLT